MMHLLLGKTTKSWTQDLLESLRSSIACQEVTYVIERCCERLADGHPDDGISLKDMYETAQHMKAGITPQPFKEPNTPHDDNALIKRNIAELLQTLKNLPEIRKRTMSGPCKLRCHKSLVKLGKSWLYPPAHYGIVLY